MSKFDKYQFPPSRQAGWRKIFFIAFVFEAKILCRSILRDGIIGPTAFHFRRLLFWYLGTG
jgi:hypothetical protein